MRKGKYGMDYERFAPLVTPHTEVMARVAAALIGLGEAEDAAQEALVRAWRAWPSLRDADATRAWLLQITVNVCRTWRSRRQGPRLTIEDRLDADALDQRPDPSAPGATDHVDALDLRRALRALDDDLRLVVALRFYAGMDSFEIGELLTVSPATIRGRLHRALVRLRRLLDDADLSQANAPHAALRKDA